MRAVCNWKRKACDSQSQIIAYFDEGTRDVLAAGARAGSTSVKCTASS